MEQGKIHGENNYSGQSVRVDVQAIKFEEDGLFFTYIPALDLTGYGNTASEAEESLAVVLDEFLRYTIAKNTLIVELQRLGWKIKNKRKPMSGPHFSDLINSNDQLRDIVNNKQYKTSNYSVNVPAFA